MPGNLLERVTVLQSAVLRRGSTSFVPVRDCVHGAISWYGLHRRHTRRTCRVRPHSEGFIWVELERYGICWPSAAPLERLMVALVELSVPSNAHYYFREGTTLRAGDRVIDVGACEGSFALEAIVRYGASRVWCFEPGPTMAHALRKTSIGNNVADQLQVVEAAAGSESGVLSFADCVEDPTASRLAESGPTAALNNHCEVRQLRLDDWVREADVDRIDYIKIDAEGSDLGVLEGAAELITRWRPRIAVTTYHNPTHCESMIAFLDSLRLGYQFKVRGIVAFGSSARAVMLHAWC